MFILKSGAHHTINQGKNRNIKPILSCLQDALTNSVRNIRITPLLKEDNKLVEYGVKEEKSSKAMRAYLERSQEYNRFIAKESEEFRTGKRHLANMMGKDPNNFSQADVDAAIAYLFPSGLFVKKTRPMMKPPEEVHPPKKEAEFDETGRPHHYLFYTGKPNFYSYMHNLVSTMKELNAFQDAMIAKQLKPDPALALDTEGYEWLSKDAFELKFIEDITDEEHRQLIATLDRLLSHPYSYRIKDLIMEARKVNVIKTDEAIPKPELSADGRQFITVKECRRRMSRADVTVHYPGQGLLTVNGYDLSYFPDLNNREQIVAVPNSSFTVTSGLFGFPKPLTLFPSLVLACLTILQLSINIW